MKRVSGSSHVSLFLPSLKGGGAQRVLVTLSREGVRRNHAVDLVLARVEGPYLSNVPEGVRVVDLCARRTLFALPALVRYLRSEQPDALLATLPHANVIALLARHIAGVSTRVVVREANMLSLSLEAEGTKGRVLRLMMRWLYPKADGIVAVSRGVADDLKRAIPVLQDRVKVIYNPVIETALVAKASEPIEHEWLAPGAPPVILGVGRLTRQKDFPTLVKAFARVKTDQDARLVILGEGEDRVRLEKLVAELGIRDDVSLPGFVDNPFQWMANAAVFVLSSAWEGLPNVLIQAMACGCPVVSTECPSGPAEILRNGKLGRIVPVGDDAKMARAIKYALDGSINTDALKRRALDFSAGALADQYLEYALPESRYGCLRQHGRVRL